MNFCTKRLPHSPQPLSVVHPVSPRPTSTPLQSTPSHLNPTHFNPVPPQPLSSPLRLTLTLPSSPPHPTTYHHPASPLLPLYSTHPLPSCPHSVPCTSPCLTSTLGLFANMLMRAGVKIK
ncbi:hypothetical protein Pmani_030253 [Petrolisthes manimaculis]|uniref:Uncharacterized protein n=1 Tax=Petrolisthes manimaculis TaxID=1843537 RepID=A0AAE1TT20_9EUCA|nr:hypothetical protein Pmani_030253 [Petrolisthes manimaculis]